MLPLLMLAKLLEVNLNYGYLVPMGKPQRSAVVEAIDILKVGPPSMSKQL